MYVYYKTTKCIQIWTFFLDIFSQYVLMRVDNYSIFIERSRQLSICLTVKKKYHNYFHTIIYNVKIGSLFNIIFLTLLSYTISYQQAV